MDLEGRIVDMQPCTEDGRITLEVFLGTEDKKDILDGVKLCEILPGFSVLEKVKCSKKLGYAMFEYAGKRIHIFKSGKVIIRRADDKEDAIRTLKIVMLAVLPVVKCPNCTKGAFACSLDDCERVLGDVVKLVEPELVGELGDGEAVEAVRKILDEVE